MKKVRHECNRDTLDKKRKLATAIFILNYPDLAVKHGDDFGSYCVEQWLQGRSEKTKLTYLAIDYIRGITICKKRPQGRRGVDAMRCDPIQLKVSFLKAKAPDNMLDFHAADVIDSNLSLNRLERAILVLQYRWGFEDNEIGHMFGMSVASTKKYKELALDKLKIQTNIDEQVI